MCEELQSHFVFISVSLRIDTLRSPDGHVDARLIEAERSKQEISTQTEPFFGIDLVFARNPQNSRSVCHVHLFTLNLVCCLRAKCNVCVPVIVKKKDKNIYFDLTESM